jgi:F0F1-type ATP synthase assembly protein I
MAIKMAVVIYLGIYLGQKIDGPNEGEVPWFTLVGALLGVGLSFYFVVKDLRDI